MHGAQVHDREGRENERPATLRVPSHVAARNLDSGACTRCIALRTKVNNKRAKIPPATAEQFAVAARIAARVISQFRHAGSRRTF